MSFSELELVTGFLEGLRRFGKLSFCPKVTCKAAIIQLPSDDHCDFAKSVNLFSFHCIEKDVDDVVAISCAFQFG